jgi:hypothetical protein
VNPIEESVFEEADIARRQYAALLRYADDPAGLPARLERDREGEMTRYQHRMKARFGMKMATLATLGIYRHHEKEMGTLAQERHTARQIEFLARVAKSGPEAQVVWNMDEVRRAVDEVAAQRLPHRSAELVARIMHQTNDAETRALCERALRSIEPATVAGGGMR